ncbi:hypothetical protein FB45DRAFT_895774 [Roridomyces roridus]|uniref:Uncharacterized protein n=1 Tax=Roridomyces roridus TaxID=1738132 RepID=A0AAD7CA92_9AGAR|nr:hypothetical protein FB45DRAFT_895774 [Roridomyces roridus]
MSPPTQKQLLFAADALFLDFDSNTPCSVLISHFSSDESVVLQHAPARCPHRSTSLMTGPNAVRSYLDLLATYWYRSDSQIHERKVVGANRVEVSASVRWTWRSSGRSWVEDFVCLLDYDEHLKVVGMTVDTKSAPGTCIMRAVDAAEPILWTLSDLPEIMALDFGTEARSL